MVESGNHFTRVRDAFCRTTARMGLTICLMHYNGMAAVKFTASSRRERASASLRGDFTVGHLDRNLSARHAYGNAEHQNVQPAAVFASANRFHILAPAGSETAPGWRR